MPCSSTCTKYNVRCVFWDDNECVRPWHGACPYIAQQPETFNAYYHKKVKKMAQKIDPNDPRKYYGRAVVTCRCIKCKKTFNLFADAIIPLKSGAYGVHTACSGEIFPITDGEQNVENNQSHV